MKRVLTIGALALLGAYAAAQPFYIRGDFNSWSTANQFNLNNVTNRLEATVTGLTVGTYYEFKAADAGWSVESSGSNSRFVASSTSMTFTLNPATTHTDNWRPNNRMRVGLIDPNLTWEVMGDFPTGNNFSTPLPMTLDGQGYFVAEIPAAQLTAGSTYNFKMRRTGDWGMSIGDDWGNSAANASFTMDPTWGKAMFILDQQNGRWQVVPEPASMIALGLGAAALLRRRKKA